MVLLELAIFPNDKGTSLSPYVARCVDIIDKSGLAYQFSAMSTTIEGDWDEVMKVVGERLDARDFRFVILPPVGIGFRARFGADSGSDVDDGFVSGLVSGK